MILFFSPSTNKNPGGFRGFKSVQFKWEPWVFGGGSRKEGQNDTHGSHRNFILSNKKLLVKRNFKINKNLL